MSGGHLTPEDRESLRGLGQGQVAAVVEAIVAAHVTAALNEAADAIEQTPAEQWPIGRLLTGSTEAEQRGYFAGANQAIDAAARIVRARTT